MTYGEGLTLANIGRMYAEQNDSEQATKYWLEAQRVLAALEVPEAQEVTAWLAELEKDAHE